MDDAVIAAPRRHRRGEPASRSRWSVWCRHGMDDAVIRRAEAASAWRAGVAVALVGLAP
jgi:hypothetical protein